MTRNATPRTTRILAATLLFAAAAPVAAAVLVTIPGCPRFQQSPVQYRAPEKEFITVREIRFHYLERRPAKTGEDRRIVSLEGELNPQFDTASEFRRLAL